MTERTIWIIEDAEGKLLEVADDTECEAWSRAYYRYCYKPPSPFDEGHFDVWMTCSLKIGWTCREYVAVPAEKPASPDNPIHVGYDDKGEPVYHVGYEDSGWSRYRTEDKIHD